MGRNPMTYDGYPSARGTEPSSWFSGIVYSVIVLLVFMGMVLIGIPTESDLK